jgi:hypothetical protein
LIGLAVGLAIAYAEITGKATADVLFFGQDGLGPLMSNAATYSAGRWWCWSSARASRTPPP